MSEYEIIVDSFAGGGGASLGIEWATGRGPDIAINHDAEAIELHKANHPHSQHFREDVWKVDPVAACAGRPVGLMWLSPDCKHFSKAKGGKPVSKRVRGLAWVAVRWANAVRPRVIVLENVEEFQTWGPLGPDGRPCPARRGKTFKLFKRRLENLGYEVQHRELRGCDYGAPTIRRRLFLIARSDGQPIVWPEPTHGPGRSHPWRTAAECIDWSIPCPSIFLSKEEGRAVGAKRPLAPATLRRIARGVQRYVIENPSPYLVSYYGDGFSKDRLADLDQPLPTQTTENRFGLVVPFLTEHANGSTQRNFAVTDPLRTQCAGVKGGHFALVAPHITKFRSGATGAGMDEPLPTVTANGFIKRPGGSVPLGVVAAFMAQHNTDVVGHHMTEPVSTIVGKGCTQALVAAHIAAHFGTSVGAQLDLPLHTITAQSNHHALVTSQLMVNNSGHSGGRVDAPVSTITSTEHIAEVRAFLLKYYGTDQDPRLEEPLHSVTTKDRFGLVTVHGENYVIVDIGMRMLAPRELYRAQGFPDSYRIDIEHNGKPLTKTAQVRMVGNSVCPPLAAAIVAANFEAEVVERAA